jgi:hypothetical protein
MLTGDIRFSTKRADLHFREHHRMQRPLSEEKLYSKDPVQRIEALEEFVKNDKVRRKRKWINLHVHTNESFSAFSSPAESVLHAYEEDIRYFGINDHYTIAGHPEFRNACEVAGLRAVFSVEAIAMDDESLRKRKRYNDPANPGRIYIIGKGVTRDLDVHSRENAVLNEMREAIRSRNKKIVSKLDSYAAQKGFLLEFTYDDVVSLTSRGNTTERHVLQAFFEKVCGLSNNLDELSGIFTRLVEERIRAQDVKDAAGMQNLLRARLVRSGRPCFVEENRKAFTTIENLVRIHRGYGAIPSYGLMGNPVTEEEEDIERLIKKMRTFGIFALDLFEFRTELPRARFIIEKASELGVPVFIGTEHNTKSTLPLTGDIGRDTELYPYLKKSADFICGHQLLSTLCGCGYLMEDGTPRFKDFQCGFDFFARAGGKSLTQEECANLKECGEEEVREFLIHH